MYENFKYIEPMIRERIESGIISGANTMVIHKGETVFESTLGMADKEKGIAMQKDTIFRLFSMTKPITAAAAIKLLEMGKIELRYPVKWFLPTFENPQILDENGLRPASRDITIQDLMTMTSGAVYPDNFPAGNAMGELWGTQSYNYLNGGKLFDTHEFALEMGKKPLAFEPGEKWMYGTGADIMGAVIEVVSGMKFSEFLKKNFFEPLEMVDTGFFIPEDKYHRLAQAYELADGVLKPFTHFHLCLTDYRKPPAFESGGAGLVSTISDYANFAKMLQCGGEFNGRRILSRKSVELLGKNFLNDKQIASLDWDSMKGHGYGCFMRVLLDRTAAGSLQSEGAFGWDGWMGCYFSNDPKEELAMLYFIQLAGAGSDDFTRKLQNVIWGSV